MRGRRTKSRTAAAGDFLLKNPSTHDDRRRACVRAWSLVDIIITVTCRYFRSYYVRSMYVVVCSIRKTLIFYIASLRECGVRGSTVRGQQQAK